MSPKNSTLIMTFGFVFRELQLSIATGSGPTSNQNKILNHRQINRLSCVAAELCPSNA
jgi:hypothetical protein